MFNDIEVVRPNKRVKGDVCDVKSAFLVKFLGKSPGEISLEAVLTSLTSHPGGGL
jgi:hypothetical protein